MTIAQHPATEVLSAIIPLELCRIICKFAAPHAAPTITTVYQLIRTEQKEELAIFAARWQVPCNSVQHIVEFSPNFCGGVYAKSFTPYSREIRVSSSWARERDRYGLGGVRKTTLPQRLERKNLCLCKQLGGTAAQAVSCVWFLGEEHINTKLPFGRKRVELGKGEPCPYTYGPVSLRHLRSDATFRSAEGMVVGFEHFCELDGGFSDRALFSIRRYKKWVWSIHDERHWIDESFAVNRLGRPAWPHLRLMVKQLMKL